MYTVEGMTLPLKVDEFIEYQCRESEGNYTVDDLRDDEKELFAIVVDHLNNVMDYSRSDLFDFFRYCKEYEPELQTTEWFDRYLKSLCWWSLAVYEAVHGEIKAPERKTA